MPTPFESAQLILTLYDQRREETMRKARDFFVREFDPATFEEYMAVVTGPHGAYVRMVVSYWEMAASFVTHGALDRQMFIDTAGEFILVFAKIEPFLAQTREAFGNPDFASHLERLVLSLPNARERIDGMMKRLRGMVAASRAAAAASN